MKIIISDMGQFDKHPPCMPLLLFILNIHKLYKISKTISICIKLEVNLPAL